MTNLEKYFGTPNAAMRMEVHMLYRLGRLRIAVYVCNPYTKLTFESHFVKDFFSWDEYRNWLQAEYDDGTIRWDE